MQLLLAALLMAARPTPVIIDTDMGTDDMMAIALILAHREITIEAITVVNGIAHVAEGAANARRLIAASGRTGIAVYEGRATTPRDFPEEWRKASNQSISNLNIPPTTNLTAQAWLQQRCKDAAHPVRILALGPLTNLASTASSKAVEEIVMMGGAFKVPGNLNGAEGNFYADPESAAKVFRSGVPLRVIPLDATNHVKLDAMFVTNFKARTKGPLAQLVSHILDAAYDDIAHGEFYAWDPLAAIALLDPTVATWTPAHASIDANGRSTITSGTPNAQLALSASRERFVQVFRSAFQ